MARYGRSGSEPVTARSSVRLRLVLACFGVLACGIATLWLVELARQRAGDTRTVLTVLAALAFIAALVAVADVVVLIRRRGTNRS